MVVVVAAIVDCVLSDIPGLREKASAVALSKKKRSEIARKGAAARWKKRKAVDKE